MQSAQKIKLYRELGGRADLVLLDTPAVTPGMVVVGVYGEDYERRPELRFQVWPNDLEEADERVR